MDIAIDGLLDLRVMICFADNVGFCKENPIRDFGATPLQLMSTTTF